MELHHQFTVPAAVGTTWETFMDLAGVAACFPGATVTSLQDNRFEGTCKVKLGPIAMMYAGSGQFVSRDDDAHRATIEATGKDKRGNGTASATVTIALEEESGEGTSVDVTTDLNVTGKPAQFGRGVLQDVSDKLLGQFVACLEKRFAEQPVPDTAVEAPQAAESNEPAPATPRAADRDRPALVSASAGGNDVALDLGATVLPVLLRSYAPHLIAGALGFVLGALVMRRRHR